MNGMGAKVLSVAGLTLALLVSGARGQEAPAASSETAGRPAAASTGAAAGQQAPESHARKAIRWKQFDYTCEGAAKVVVYLHDTTAKVVAEKHVYLMRQTPSADGNRYSDGKVVWWGKGNGGFLQEDTPDGDGKMFVKGCSLDRPVSGEANTVTGTVSYMVRMALPPNSEVQVQLLDVTLADAPAKVLAEDKFLLGERQVPVPFTLKYDPAKIDARHTYSVSARILMDGQLRFISDTSYLVITQSHSSKVELVLKPVGGGKP